MDFLLLGIIADHANQMAESHRPVRSGERASDAHDDRQASHKKGMEHGKRRKPFDAAAEFSPEFLKGLSRIEDPIAVNIELVIVDFFG